MPSRKIFEGVLWILRTGAQWSELPRKFPPYQTVHRRFQHWNIDGSLTPALTKLARHLESKGSLDLSECAVDGTFASAKKGLRVGKTKRGKGSKIMAITDRNGLPVALRIDRASPAEVTFVEDLIEDRLTKGKPKVLLGDKAYDSDALDKRLAKQGIEMVAPNKVNRRVRTQDGRRLRRYKRRWRVERAFAWLNSFRRTVTRWEMYSFNFRGFLQIACMSILARSFLR